LGFGVGEIDQQTNFVSSGFEVVEQLGFMDFLQGFYRFEFNDNVIFNHDIRKILSNFMALVSDLDRNLCFRIKTKVLQFDEQSIFINFLKKS
jgi:hypothetical protein